MTWITSRTRLVLLITALSLGLLTTNHLTAASAASPEPPPTVQTASAVVISPAQVAAYLQSVYDAVQAYLHAVWWNSLPKVPPLLHEIAMCESVNGAYIHRDHPSPTSTASGKYGFLDGTWRSWRAPEGTQYARAMDAPEWVQDQAAIRLFNASGTAPWEASRYCWSR